MSEYIYENKIKECPNCGALLGKNDKECPNCSINLVGLNEKDNRATNLNHSAGQMENILKQHGKIQEKIRKDNEKKRKSTKALIIIFSSIIGVFLLIMLAIGLTDMFSGISTSTRYQTLEEVATEFKNAKDIKTITIEMLDMSNKGNEKGNEKHTIKDVPREYYTYSMFFNSNEETIINFEQCDSKYIRTMTTKYDANTVFLPKVDLVYDEIEYKTKDKINVTQKFETAYSYDKDSINVDEFVLDEYIRDDKNIVEKYCYVKLVKPETEQIFSNKKSLDFTVYIIEQAGSYDTPRLLVVAQLDDFIFYEIEFSAYPMESIYEIADNIEDYMQCEYREEFIGNLD